MNQEFSTYQTDSERTARQEAQLRIEELQAQLVRADAERCMAVSNAMRRIQAREKLTYTDKEVELIMLGWQAELFQANAARMEAQQRLADAQELAARSGLAHRMAVQAAVREALQEAKKACENLPAPGSCSGIEKYLWDVATMACAEAVCKMGTP
jgi:hypothetical protein